MKQKLFTLMTLLVLCVTGANATDYTWTFASTSTGSLTTGTTTGQEISSSNGVKLYYMNGSGTGTASEIKAKDETIGTVDYTKYFYMGGNGASTPTTSGNGRWLYTDNISGKGTLTVVYSGEANAGGTCYVYKSTSASAVGEAVKTFTPVKNSVNTVSGTIDKGEGAPLVLCHSAKSAICAIIWTESTGVDTNSPTCTTSQTSESVQAGMNLNLSVTAEHYTGLQWYKATLSNLSDAAAIPSATNTTYTYTPEDADASNTYYFYCVATNDDATSAKTAQSGTITVNVTVAQLASQTYTNNNTTCTWGDFNVQVAGNTIKSGNGLFFNAASGSKIQMNNGNLQVVSGNLMYVEVPSASSSGTVTILNGTTTGRYFQTESEKKVYIKADTGQPNTIDFTSADVVTVDDVPYLKLTSKSDNKFNGVKIVLNGGFVKTNAGKWASFTPASTAVYNGGSAMTSFTLPAEAKAYIVTDIDETNVTASVVDVMGAGNGYFIKGEGTKTTYPVALTTDAASATTDNLLVAVTSPTIINASTPDTNTKFVLGTKAGEQSGLFKVTSNVTVAAGKAYLNAQKTVEANSLSLDFSDVTGIQTIEAQKELLEGDFYNLSGQKVAQPTKGLYIVNGRKVVIK